MLYMLKKKKNKNRIAFKRTHDFWAGFALASLIACIILLFVWKIDFETKSFLLAIIGVEAMFLFYLNKTSKIIKAAGRSLLFWKKKHTIHDYSVAIEYKTLNELVESKRNLEEALKMIKGLEDDHKINELIKYINNNNNNDRLWKN